MSSRCFFIASNWSDSPLALHFRALAQELAARGNRVVFLADGNQCEGEDHEANPAVIKWPSPRPTKLRDALFLRKLIQRYRPDCLIANFASVNVMSTVGWMMRVPVRVVWYHTLSTQLGRDSHASSWRTSFQQFRKRMVYQLATHLVANAEATREDLRAVYRLPAEKCHVAYYTLRDPFANGGIPGVELGAPRERERRIQCVGRLDPSKGHDVLIRAMQILKTTVPEAKVEFVGEGANKETLIKLAQELGVSDRCIFAGRVPNVEVLRRMATAAVTVVPSLTEAFGLVNIESFAVGTPVVASRVGGIPEIFHNEQEGFLVPPGDPQALADKLAILLTDAELRETKGRAARERFLDRFEQRAMIVPQAEWYERIVAERSK